jgi:hypothetical protein
MGRIMVKRQNILNRINYQGFLVSHSGFYTKNYADKEFLERGSTMG